MKKSDLIYGFFLGFFLVASVFLPCQMAASPMPYTFRPQWAVLSPQQTASLPFPVQSTEPVPLLVLWLEPSPGYHTYARRPGAQAMPTTVSVPTELGAQIRYLPGQPQADVFEPENTVQVYEGPTPVFLLFPQGPPQGELAISMLACSEQNCVPLNERLALAPPAVLEKPSPAWFGSLMASLPDSAPDSPQKADQALLDKESDNMPDNIHEAINDVPDDAPEYWDFSPRPFQPSLEVGNLGKAIVLGLVAGLLLNIMPCVLPVLTFKISALMAIHTDPEQGRRHFREHNLLFAAGILVWFTALALLLGLADMAWGQLFQSKGLVLGLILMVFCLALSMFDVFHLPVFDLRMGSTASPRMQAFSTGLLATLLATPCSGPLLGGVLGWSLVQSLPVLVLVFLCTGLGMAIPYLFLAWKPGLVVLLPRPGAWMLVFERILGFCLMGTVIYLFSILPKNLYVPSLIALLAVAVLAWIWGRWGSLASLRRRLCIGAGCLSVLVLVLWVCFSSSPAVRWEEFEANRFRTQLGRTALLVEFTADWCPTCKVLEQAVLTPRYLEPLVRRYGLKLIRVDLTQHDENAQSLLKAMNSASIPLLAIFPPGEGFATPTVLRDIYTPSQMAEAVEEAMQMASCLDSADARQQENIFQLAGTAHIVQAPSINEE